MRHDSQHDAPPEPTDRAGESAVIPVVDEQVEVGKRVVETGRVRVRKVVREEQEVIDASTLSEQVTVERVPVNRVVEGPVAPRQEGDTLILPVLEEVVVVERRLMLKEEVRITRHATRASDPKTVTLRKEEVKVERLGPHGRPGTHVADEGGRPSGAAQKE